MNFSIYKKKYRPKITFVLGFFFSILSLSVLGQKVAIEDVIQKDQQVYVYYTLEGNSVYEVNLYFVLDEGDNGWTRAQIVSGDVGEKQKGGFKTKLIVWDVIADKGELVGKCDFKVTAIDTKDQKKMVNHIRRPSKQDPMNQIAFVSNIAYCPFGLNLHIFKNNKLGFYFDFRSDLGLMQVLDRPNGYQSYADDEYWVVNTMGCQYTNTSYSNRGGYTTFNVGVSPALRLENSTLIFHFGIGLSKQKLYRWDEYYQPILQEYYYVTYDEGGRVLSNINYGIILQTNLNATFQIGFDTQIIGFTLGVGIGF